MNKQALKIGVVGIPGKWSTEVLADELEQQTGFRLVIDISQVQAQLQDRKVTYQGHNLCALDGLIIKKVSQHYSPQVLDRLELLRFIEGCGVAVFSKPSEIIRLINRMSCTVSLANAGIAMPQTILTEDLNTAIKAVQELKAVILKPLFSTKARGMEVLKASQSEKQLTEKLQAFQQKNGFFYIQQRLNLPGRDMGLVFLNGVYQGAYARVAKDGSWNTTIHSGGRYEKIEPEANIIAMAQNAQAQFDLSYTTVDIAETEHGPVCFEVSAFGGFKGAQEGLGLNMAKAYSEFVIQQCQNQ